MNARISPDDLRKLLRYDPDTGKLFWLPRPEECFTRRGVARMWNTRFANKEAFTAVDRDGYRVGTIGTGGSRSYSAHRVIWAIVTGEWPPRQVDHENRNKSDNRWRNLRLATPSENGANKGITKSNTSGARGVSWCAQTQKWKASIRKGGRIVTIGRFHTLDDASRAYQAESFAVYGEFASGH